VFEVGFFKTKSYFASEADPEGHFGATVPPNGCGAPWKWLPSDENAPLFSAYRSRNRDKKYSKL